MRHPPPAFAPRLKLTSAFHGSATSKKNAVKTKHDAVPSGAAPGRRENMAQRRPSLFSAAPTALFAPEAAFCFCSNPCSRSREAPGRHVNAHASPWRPRTAVFTFRLANVKGKAPTPIHHFRGEVSLLPRNRASTMRRSRNTVALENSRVASFLGVYGAHGAATHHANPLTPTASMLQCCRWKRPLRPKRHATPHHKGAIQRPLASPAWFANENLDPADRHRRLASQRLSLAKRSVTPSFGGHVRPQLCCEGRWLVVSSCPL
ncbi:hypothetical protein TraAM80_09237 [Trypanosoma rangeli]|uniref:Uncharacterized protein n=1 Tax=Trypanosoma rangeli TaxID=5698 RepID=A0A422MWY8_TRYRA|nr:uncharacterized protein TraAM80_09237 [Trypanosoma rangeli]RNE97723.1 hypothetical protein TraAM80_09237 [Trypanosoma rangeli]|eukprot:RNE97723.1 hypothetical protein TraAM80_09237 [Trypanosoma rangeli]